MQLKQILPGSERSWDGVDLPIGNGGQVDQRIQGAGGPRTGGSADEQGRTTGRSVPAQVIQGLSGLVGRLDRSSGSVEPGASQAYQ